MARLIPLFSGSSGNSYYLGDDNSGILLDIGRNCKQTTEMLNSLGISPEAIKGIFVTHEHGDHVKGLRVFASKFKTPVWATDGTIGALERMGELNGKFPYYQMQEGVSVGGMEVYSFRTSHDCAESCGYRVHMPDGKVFSLATDLGFVSDEVRDGIKGSDYLVIESNHDVGMLNNGPYPYVLKQRILSNRGHLSNDSCASLLPELIKEGTRQFMLAHISRENNMPELAFQTSVCQLTMEGMKEDIDFTLTCARKENIDGRKIEF
jgi:phosphoribosyl 1,2-cyclic phosphodiesterase